MGIDRAPLHRDDEDRPFELPIDALRTGEIQLNLLSEGQFAKAEGQGIVGITRDEVGTVPYDADAQVPLSVVVHEGVHALKSAGKIMGSKTSSAVEEFAAHHYEAEFLERLGAQAKTTADEIWSTVTDLYEEEGYKKP
ncbi:MAG TPA: hypothetical protein VGM39_01310 [Kofleriaceae bacterium]